MTTIYAQPRLGRSRAGTNRGHIRRPAAVRAIIRMWRALLSLLKGTSKAVVRIVGASGLHITRIIRYTPVGAHAWLEARVGWGGTIIIRKPVGSIPGRLLHRS